LVQITQQEFGEGVAAVCAGLCVPLAGIRNLTRENWCHLVEVLTVEFEPHAEGVLAASKERLSTNCSELS